jgi:hypothetical protein
VKRGCLRCQLYHSRGPKPGQAAVALLDSIIAEIAHNWTESLSICFNFVRLSSCRSGSLAGLGLALATHPI